MPVYALGFKELADNLGKDVVGEPLSDEQKALTVQATTQGYMLYAPGGHPMFIRGLKVGDDPGKA